ncbi:MAG: polysaccharide deacetylase family protein [Gemmatimonadota bacterium]
MARSFVKRAFETGLLHLGPAAYGRARHRDRTLVLAYHNILPRGEAPVGDRSLHLPQDLFGAQLDALVAECEVVPLTEALLQREPSEGRPRVAITFDDAYAGALEVGVEELVRRNLPATMFVAPGILGGRTLWWDATGGDGKLRDRVLSEGHGHPDVARQMWIAGGGTWVETPDYARSGSAASVARFAALKGMSLGAHGWLHLNLATAASAARDRELRAPLDWFEEQALQVQPVLAYPFGLYSRDVPDAVRAVGYESALRVDGGWLPSLQRGTAFEEPRLNVAAGLSTRGFRLRLAGLFR